MEEEKFATPIVSLCIPTNGIAEWVFPVLDCIYNQGVNKALYEVIVTDNGKNEAFYEKMNQYIIEHENLSYKRTDAFMFHNQLEALKMARGEYFKFVNHRSLIVDGGLAKMIEFIQLHSQEKPVIYFSNGALQYKEKIKSYSEFDEFVASLGRLVSWTTGVGIWRDDYSRLPENIKIDKISPHSCILFAERHRDTYIINDELFFVDVDADSSKKGTYDLFKAFAVEEPTIVLNLYIDGDIKASTFKSVKRDYKKFVKNLYCEFCIEKTPCSYDLSGFEDAMGIFMEKREILLGGWLRAVVRRAKKIIKRNL